MCVCMCACVPPGRCDGGLEHGLIQTQFAEGALENTYFCGENNKTHTLKRVSESDGRGPTRFSTLLIRGLLARVKANSPKNGGRHCGAADSFTAVATATRGNDTHYGPGCGNRHA
eukprot:Opistho-2@52134